MAMTDGLLGWPGLGQGGSLEWKVIRLYTGNVFYAPKSGYYLFWGAGGGGGGSASGGGSGATLFGFPLYVPESAGGLVTIGAGGSVLPATAGSATSWSDLLILGGGQPGTSGTNDPGGASGVISGKLVTYRGAPIISQGAAGDASATNVQAGGGAGGFNSSALTNDLVSDLLNGRFRIAKGGVSNGPAAESVGAGGAGGSGAGAPGGLIIAYI